MIEKFFKHINKELDNNKVTHIFCKKIYKKILIILL